MGLLLDEYEATQRTVSTLKRADEIACILRTSDIWWTTNEVMQAVQDRILGKSPCRRTVLRYLHAMHDVSWVSRTTYECGRRREYRWQWNGYGQPIY